MVQDNEEKNMSFHQYVDFLTFTNYMKVERVSQSNL